MAINPNIAPGPSTSASENSNNLVRSDQTASLARLSSCPPIFTERFMTGPDFQTSKQKPCRTRPATELWRPFATTYVALAIFASAAFAESTPLPELPQPEETPMLVEPSPIGDIEYRPGRGLKLGDTRFTLGGFGTVTASRLEGERGRFRLDDVDLFVFFDPTPYLHVFADFSFDKVLDLDASGDENTSSADAAVERLYADLNVGDRANFRLGKFFTPIGRWNQVSAEPLVWTTSRPAITNGPFDQRITGAEFWGSLFPSGGSLTYTLYGQFLPALPSVARTPDTGDDSAGARLEFSALGDWSAGASYFTFSQNAHWRHLGGLDGVWRRDHIELSGEFLAGQSETASQRIYGLYVQAAVEIASHIYAVARYEYFDQGSPDPTLDLYDAGLAWRPIPFLILKADYLFANHSSNAERPGIRSSLSLLF